MRGAPAGDLYIFLSIRPHRFFRRDGTDIHVRVPVTMTTAALGGQIEVPTVEGKLVRVVQIFVETPVNLTKKQKEILENFAGDGKSAKKHSPESTGFLDKVKELWEDLRD